MFKNIYILTLWIMIFLALGIYPASTLEDVHTRFYQKNGFVLCEPLDFADEGAASVPEIQRETETFIDNGFIHDANRALLDTNERKSIYVIDHKGTLYAAAEQDHSLTQLSMHHTYFLKSKPGKVGYGIGKNVACGGVIKIKAGKIIYIDNISGHYFPNEDQLKICIHDLYQKGVLGNDLIIKVKASEAEGGYEYELPLIDILSSDKQSILDNYPLAVKRTQEYIENRKESMRGFKREVLRLKKQIPSLGSKLNDFLPDFCIPTKPGQFELGIKEQDKFKWRVVFSNWTSQLPEFIKGASSDTLRITQSQMAMITDNEGRGRERRSAAFCYDLNCTLLPGCYFRLYLVPIISGDTSNFPVNYTDNSKVMEKVSNTVVNGSA